MERLLIKAKAGDNYAIQLLLNKYKNLLNSASRQHHLISIQEEAYEEVEDIRTFIKELVPTYKNPNEKTITKEKVAV